MFPFACHLCGQLGTEARLRAEEPAFSNIDQSVLIGQMIDLSGFVTDIHIENEEARFLGLLANLPRGEITIERWGGQQP